MVHDCITEYHFYQFIDENESSVRIFALGCLNSETPCECTVTAGSSHVQKHNRLNDPVRWIQTEVLLSQWCPCYSKRLITITPVQWSQIKQHVLLDDDDNKKLN